MRVANYAFGGFGRYFDTFMDILERHGSKVNTVYIESAHYFWRISKILVTIAAAFSPNAYIVMLQISTSLVDQDRHIRKKKLRDISKKIHKVQLRMHNRKAKRDVAGLQAQLNALNKQYDETSRGNFKRPARKPLSITLCPVCHGSIGKGYHICKPGQWKR